MLTLQLFDTLWHLKRMQHCWCTHQHMTCRRLHTRTGWYNQGLATLAELASKASYSRPTCHRAALPQPAILKPVATVQTSPGLLEAPKGADGHQQRDGCGAGQSARPQVRDCLDSHGRLRSHGCRQESRVEARRNCQACTLSARPIAAAPY